jgi:hypothetical protein
MSSFHKESHMSVAALEQPEVIRSMQAALAEVPVAKPLPTGNAVDNKPLVGGEINIRLALSPGMVTLLSAPITVAVTMLLGWLMLKTAGMPIYPGEMIGGAIVNVLGGVAAAAPLFILMKKGAAAIAQAGILGIALRIGTVLMAMLLAGAPAWGLERMPLVYWVLGYYFPMLIVETAVVAWLSNKAKH